jgi:hypothetical protein
MLAALTLALLLQPAPAAPAPPVATIDDVRFMAGHWVGDMGGGLSEEVWTEPSGNGMLGMWRYVAGGEARVLELLTLTAGPDGVTLRLRHFDGRLVAREEKDAPLAFKLVKSGPREARFEGTEKGETVRLAYRAEGDTLVSVLDKGGKPQEFRFKRK